jgi:hypothetical protein
MKGFVGWMLIVGTQRGSGRLVALVRNATSVGERACWNAGYAWTWHAKPSGCSSPEWKQNDPSHALGCCNAAYVYSSMLLGCLQQNLYTGV